MAGIILAGGAAKRMGGVRKSLQLLAGKTLLDRVVERLNPLFDELVITHKDQSAFIDNGDIGELFMDMAGFKWGSRCFCNIRVTHTRISVPSHECRWNN
jgi:molybdopterin-guanine dinucleotide biosynthesis protein A